jgi:Sec-independent protein translocase protein TatA
MLESKAKKRIFTSIITIAVLVLVVLGCKSLPGATMNMFEGTNAQDGAAKVKAKLGVENVKVSRMEIHEDRMSIVVQDPNKPKNFDEYTYEKGSLSGPKPVQAMTLGNQEFTADKSRLFDLSEVNLGLVPDVCRKAVEKSQVEEGKCENIGIDWESARWTRSKEETDRLAAAKKEEMQKQIRAGKYDAMKSIRESVGDLVVTWRVWIKGPRATKDFWVDSKGTVWDYH